MKSISRKNENSDYVDIDAVSATVTIGGDGDFPANKQGLSDAMQHCVNNRKYRRILVEESIYVDEPVVIPYNHAFVIEGVSKSNWKVSGATAVKIQSTVQMDSLIKFSAGYANDNSDLTHDFGFRNIVLSGDNADNTIYCENQDGFLLENVGISGGKNGVVARYNGVTPPTASSIPGGIKMFNVSVNTNSSTGVAIDLENQTECWFDNMWFPGSVKNIAIRIKSSNTMVFSNMRLTATPIGIQLEDDAVPCHDIKIIGSTFAVGTDNKIINDLRTHQSSKRISLIGNTYPSGVIGNIHNSSEKIPQKLYVNSLNIENSPTGQIPTTAVPGASMMYIDENGDIKTVEVWNDNGIIKTV